MIRKERLIPLTDVPQEMKDARGELDFPDRKRVLELAVYLRIWEQDLYFNPKADSAPFLYYKGMVLVELPSELTLEELELTKMKIKIKQTHISLQNFVDRNEWKRVFLFMDVRILEPVFDERFSEIPEDQRSEVLQAIQKRIGTFPLLRNKEALSLIANNRL